MVTGFLAGVFAALLPGSAFGRRYLQERGLSPSDDPDLPLVDEPDMKETGK